MDGPPGRCPFLWMVPKEPVVSLSKIEEVARRATPRSPDSSGRPAACGASWASAGGLSTGHDSFAGVACVGAAGDGGGAGGWNEAAPQPQCQPG